MSFLIVLVVILGLLALVFAGVVFLLRRPLPRVDGAASIPGLKGQVEVIRDRWGVPHIYADSTDDLFFAQGFVHAQDRMWQMELQRRLASGRLSEIFGARTLEVDRFFRVLGLRRAAEADVAVLAEESRRALDAYAAGVNAFIAEQAGRWSVEFNLLRFEPEPWQPADSLSWVKVMAWNMGCDWASELLRARLAAHLGAELAADLEPSYPAENPAIVSGPGLPQGTQPPPNGWGSEAMREALRRVEDLFRVSTPASQSAAPNSIAPPAAGGSNQWTVSGQWTASGKPLLANDTHLLLQIPAPWYQIHLSGGGYDVTGVSLPGLPTVAVGHNEHCAWGMTIAWHDAQDLFMHRLNPDNPHQYEYEGEWLDADVLRESIRVKGQDEPVIQEVVITRHGPIISELVGAGMPLALRWVALEPHDLLVANLRCNRARNWDEFRTALGDWNAPSLNFVCADRDGNIGYLQVGRVPIRAGGPALAPVPGWTREYEWQGYLSPDQLPQDVNPESGRLLTANNLVVDGAYPHYLSADLENPCRARRIADLLDAQAAKGYTAEDFARFQLDTYSAQAERFVQHMLTVEPQSDLERRALDHLRAWDGCLAAESVAASIYQVCRLRALHIVFDVHLGKLADAYVGAQGLTVLGESSPYHGKSIVRLLDLLDGRGNDYWLRDPVTGHERPRHELLGRALQEALERLEAELGPDMSRWTWGRVNRVHFAHTLGSVKPLHLLFNRGPYPMGGDQDTLLRASTNPGFPREPVGVVDAVRFIADLDDWEQCRIVVPGGQSGHVGSPHYADLIPLWRKGHYQPMPFGRDRVERYARSRLTLVPKG